MRRRDRWRAWFAGSLFGAHPEPVVVLGKEKSGTTAVAALLAHLTASWAILDMPRMWGDAEKELVLGRRDLGDWIRAHPADFAAPIVKEPALTFMATQVLAALPRARLLMVVRDPRANIRSVLHRAGLPGNLRELPPGWQRNVPRGWELVVDGRWLGLEGTYVEMAARRWNLAVDGWEPHADRVVWMRYEDFRADREAALRHVARSLDLPVRRALGTAAERQFQPAFSGAPSLGEFFGPENLAVIQATCGRHMDRLGYPAGDVAA